MKNFLKKIYFFEINLIIFSTYLSLFLLNFFVVQKKLNEENNIILNNLIKAKKNYQKFEPNEDFFPYLIINSETDKINNLIDKYKILPLGTISNKNIYLCNENGNPVTFFSDNFGFRNKNIVYSNNQEKVIFLGDSNIIGFCHEYEKTIAGIVEKKFKNKKILNLSQGGTGPLIQSATIREYAFDVNFNEVYWFLFTGNDFVNLVDETDNIYLNKYINQKYTQKLKINQNKINNFYSDLKVKSYHLVTPDDDFIKRYKKKKLNFKKLFKLSEIKNFFFTRSSGQINRKIIDKYLNLIIATKYHHLKDKKLTIVILPEERTFKIKDYEKYYHLNYVKQILTKNNINVLDLANKYKNKYEFLDLYYSRYTHYNSKAQFIIADDLVRFINK